MKPCLTEKQAAPGRMYRMIGFMNMHKGLLFLETIAAVVIGAEQAGGKAAHRDVLPPPYRKF